MQTEKDRNTAALATMLGETLAAWPISERPIRLDALMGVARAVGCHSYPELRDALAVLGLAGIRFPVERTFTEVHAGPFLVSRDGEAL